MSSQPSLPSPLSGIRVVELSHLIAGPYCCQMLADEGATVIKVEPPGGELTRHREPARHCEEGEVTAYYASLNRGKSSVVIDLKCAQGVAVMERLLATADVFVTNMRTSALNRLGLHPKAVRERYPRMIIVSISGFGMDNAGQFEDRAGLAIVAEATSGATGLTRDHAGNPVWCGFALGDITAAVSAHAAVLLALRNQDRHGVGRLIDVGLAECMLPMVSVAMGRVQVEEQAQSNFVGSNNFHGIPYGAFPAADGGVSIGCNRDDFWRRLCDAMGRPELGTDPRYATYAARTRYQKEVHKITESFTRSHTRAEIVDKLVEADVPVASILNMKEVVGDEYLRRRGALWDVDDGFGGKFTLPANAAWLEMPTQPLRVPRLGEQRNAVMRDVLGMSEHEVAQLERAGAFGAARLPSHQSGKHESDIPTVLD